MKPTHSVLDSSAIAAESGSAPKDRRPVASRDWSVMQSLATALARAGATPNSISVAGCLAALLAGVSLAASAHTSGGIARALCVAAAVLILVRLIANLLDGMVAVQTGKASALGELYNDFPDRVSDVAVLFGAGLATGSSPLLGLGAAVAAVSCAYVRYLGAVAAGGQDYCGPFAKQQRMTTIAAVAMVQAIAPAQWWVARGAVGGPWTWALLLVLVGTLVTVLRRLIRIAKRLRTPRE
ncbi:MAG: CDP-alcohol phosphatidyltransferase family protein [Planctomycetota bacterium]